MTLKHGSYEVNPPFVPALLTAAAQRMLTLLQVHRRWSVFVVPADCAWPSPPKQQLLMPPLWLRFVRRRLRPQAAPSRLPS